MEQVNLINEEDENNNIVLMKNESDLERKSLYSHDFTQDNKSERNIFCCGANLNLTKSQLITICLLCPHFFLASSYYSLFAPFLPGEAIEKEISQTQVGIIFGVYQLACLIFAPLFGKYLHKFGVKFLFVSGLFISSGSEILFGFLNHCPNGFIYFFMCSICRVVTALGASMGLSFAIVGHYFPNNISSIVALLQVFNGLGLMVGPPLGGFLFQFGGFPTPFFVMGGTTFLLCIIAFFIFPDPPRCVHVTRNDSSGSSYTMSSLVMIPKFSATLTMLFVGALSIGFIEPSAEIHLLPLKLKPFDIGLILFIPALLYALVTPIVGYVCDKYPKTLSWFMFFSGLCTAVSFSFFGPVPFYHLPLKLTTFLSGIISFGFSIGGLIIPVYSQLTRTANANGFPNNIRTQGLVSGLFNSVWSLGSLVGPILGGVVVDMIGFDLASFSIVIIFLITDLLFLIVCCFSKSNNQILLEEQSPLLA